ncbi:MAG: phospho-N-acetylmuramoyl-pentapeptide-transferase [bacterium]|nr:phospho-N-acetylmuramoyl-pentapeptide-transferase [bacterium]
MITAADSLAALAIGTILTLVAGKPLIAQLKRLAFGQHIYEDGPRSHRSKSGTPTMGGMLFLVAALAAGCVARTKDAWLLVGFTIVCGAIGLLDDWLIVRYNRALGLRARTKLLLIALAAIAFLALAPSAIAPDQRFAVLRWHDGGALVTPAWLWYALSLLAVLATTNAVNLTDGLDGLAAGTMIPALAISVFIAVQSGAHGVALAELTLAGACLGFLYYNRYPARVFMGDTGSLALGALLAGGAILTGTQLLLPLIGGVFAAEALSVILQVASYKTTRRRIFRMSPLHHHFELGGWPETVVTKRFWTASAILAIAGYVVMR